MKEKVIEPIIRFEKIVIDNFRNVKHGEIDLNKYPDKADVLGLYGQNGSGKTTFIKAISIFQKVVNRLHKSYHLMQPEDVNGEYVSFAFTLSYKDEDSDISDCFITYSFKIKMQKPEKRGLVIPYVFEEIVTLDGLFFGKKYRNQLIAKTNESTEDNPYSWFEPKKTFEDVWAGSIPQKVNNPNISFIDGENNPVTEALGNLIIEHNKEEYFSLLFNLQEWFEDENIEMNSPIIKLLSDIKLWASNKISVVKTDGYGKFNLYYNTSFVGTQNYKKSIKDPCGEWDIRAIKNNIDCINTVMGAIIPDFKLVPSFCPSNSLFNGAFKSGVKPNQYTVFIFSEKNGKSIIIDEESDGIKRMISFVQDFVFAFNDPSYTIIVDEIDSGIFEFLLGQLLKIFEENAKGQLIFTSHNLRPLEVLDRNHIYFTTTNENNRYIQIKNLHRTNNLRDVYLRAIQIDDKDFNIYSSEKEFKIVTALMKADTRSIAKKIKLVQRPLTDEEQRFMEKIRNREYIEVEVSDDATEDNVDEEQ